MYKAIIRNYDIFTGIVLTFKDMAQLVAYIKLFVEQGYNIEILGKKEQQKV